MRRAQIRWLARLAGLAALALASCNEPRPRPATPPPLPSVATPVTGGDRPPIRYVVGGDSRQDAAHVVPWAFREAKARGAAGFFFLGDMERTPDLSEQFRAKLGDLAPVPFFPVLGNHESVFREHAAEAPHELRVRAVQAFRARFLGKAATEGGFAPAPPATPVDSAFADKVVYAVDLPGDVHFVALDNVSQSGFGADQLAWLAGDLERARAGGKAPHLVVGMHKALAGGGVTQHAMDEDGPGALADSAAALALFDRSHVELIVASHFHGFAEYAQHGIRSFITGGLGAPLDVAHDKTPPFHHFLVVGVPAGARSPLTVEVVRFPGAPAVAAEEER